GSWWLALAPAPLVGAAVGLLVERMMIRHLYTRPLATILATWGLSLVLQQLLQLVFGAAPQRVDGPLPGSAFIFGVAYPAYRLLLITAALSIMAACFAVFRWPRFGLGLRVSLQDADVAESRRI